MASVVESVPSRQSPDLEIELKGGRIVDYKKGAMLCRANEIVSTFRIVLSGMVLVRQKSSDATFIWGPRGRFGEEAICCTPEVVGRFAQALVPTKAMEWSGPDVWNRCFGNPLLGVAVINMLTDQLRIKDTMLRIKSVPLSARLPRALLYLDEQIGKTMEGGNRVLSGLSQSIIAEVVGAMRATITKALGDLERIGLTEPSVHSRCIILRAQYMDELRQRARL